MKKYSMCQSCGMPLSKDPKGGGTEKNGKKSSMYCSLCYEKGKFKDNCQSAEEMQAFCIKIMKEDGMPGPVAWLFTRGIPRLERWKKA